MNSNNPATPPTPFILSQTDGHFRYLRSWSHTRRNTHLTPAKGSTWCLCTTCSSSIVSLQDLTVEIPYCKCFYHSIYAHDTHTTQYGSLYPHAVDCISIRLPSTVKSNGTNFSYLQCSHRVFSMLLHLLQWLYGRFDGHGHVILHVCTDLHRLTATKPLPVRLQVEIAIVGAIVRAERYCKKCHPFSTCRRAEAEWACSQCMLCTTPILCGLPRAPHIFYIPRMTWLHNKIMIKWRC